jgi:lipopolysaccharide transport system ATP-binding protein
LQEGKLVKSGPARQIVDEYRTANADAQVATMDLTGLPRGGDAGRKFRMEKLEWLSGLPLQHGETLSARLHFRAVDDVEAVAIGLGFSTLEGNRLLTIETDFQDGQRRHFKRGDTGYADLTLPELPLAPGLYSLDTGARSGDSFGLDYLPNFTQAEIAMGLKTPGYIARQGAGVRLKCECRWHDATPAKK